MNGPVVALAAALGLALPACSLAPRYHRPALPDPPSTYKESGDWQRAMPADAQPRGPWWQMFGDEELNDLEAQVHADNQSLKAALARLGQARATTRVARADWLPTLTANVNADRARTSVNSPTYAPGRPATGNLFSAGVDLSYELDLFGRIRSNVAAARFGEQASAGDVAALELSLHAELATDYFSLRGLDVQQGLLDRTVADYTRALELTRNLHTGGAVALSDVQQAEAQLQSARTQAEDTRLRRAQTEHAIAVLIGKPASAFILAARAEAGLPRLQGVDPGLPSQLLERRPDVAAAERRVASANAGIGVARAAYFPVFTLGGSAGVESTAPGSWLTAPSRFWSLGPQALLTLFDAGRHAGESQRAHAVYDEQVANYRDTVLRAYQEVEDNLAALRQLQRERQSQEGAVQATQGALDQALLRYRGGIVTYLEVVATENAALTARLTAVDIDVRRASALVLLIRALGGDWRAAS